MKIAPSRIERFFDKFEFNTPYMLGSSDCESFTIQDILELEEGSDSHFMNLHLGYTEAKGNHELRELIAKLYQDISAEEILVFSGAEEGIFCSLNAILSAGDNFIVQSPNYQSLEELPRSIGCTVDQWKLTHESKWRCDLEALKAKVNTQTTMLAINNPHNPTGMLMKRHEVDEVVRLASQNGSYILSDEVYRFSEYEKSDALPPLCDLYEKAISLGVMSKSIGLPGLRIGWIATKDKDAYDKIAAYKDYITICNSAPSEFLSKVALKHLSKIIQRNQNIIQSNLILLDEFFDHYKDVIRWVRPNAGPITLAEIIPTIDLDQFTMKLRDEQGVLIVPGSIFDYDNQHFRLGFGRKNMREALEKFSKFLDSEFGH